MCFRYYFILVPMRNKFSINLIEVVFYFFRMCPLHRITSHTQNMWLYYFHEIIISYLGDPNDTSIETINNVRYINECILLNIQTIKKKNTIWYFRAVLSEYWNCFSVYKDFEPTVQTWKGPEVPDSAPYDIMCPTPPRNKAILMVY